MPSLESSAATTASRITEIRARVTVAEREGWYGYEQQARDDVLFLLGEIQRLQANQRTGRIVHGDA